MPVYLYTDIEGSTQLWEHYGPVMSAVLDRHDVILMACIEGWGNEHAKNTGDGMMAVFEGSEARLISKPGRRGRELTLAAARQMQLGS